MTPSSVLSDCSYDQERKLCLLGFKKCYLYTQTRTWNLNPGFLLVGWLVGYEGKRNLKTEIVLKQWYIHICIFNQVKEHSGSKPGATTWEHLYA